MIFEQPVLQLQTSLLDQSISAPTDFSLGPSHMIYQIPHNATPYCADFDNRFLICVTSPQILDRPFLYKAQREQAQSVIKIPFSELQIDNVTPTFIFSTGRCGSTLLVGILQALGVPSVSEPDYFRQIAVMSAQAAPQSSDGYVRVMRSATAMLAKRLGGPSPVIKLHLACNLAPLLITQAFPSVKLIFIVREFRGWAMSLKRVSPSLSAEAAVGTFNQALGALYSLSQFHQVRVCHYQDIAQIDVDYVQDLVSFLGHDKPVPSELLQQVLSRDSQEGTSVSRDRVAHRRIPPAFSKDVERLWKNERPDRLIQDLGLGGLI